MANIDFLGIGVQKSATSWLFKNLKNHPDIWMPPRKELHYFDRDLKYPSPDFLASDKYEDRLKSTEKHNVIFREKMIKELGNAKASGNTKMEKWRDKGHSLFQMVKSMREDSKRIKKMVMEYSLCLMVISM